MTVLKVNLTEKSYNLIIARASLAAIGHHVSQVWSPRKVAIITDDHVGPLYLNQVERSLITAGFSVSSYQVPHGEQSKSLSQVESLAQGLAKEAFNRNDGILALGGGVVGDLAGLLASIYMRGISLIQVPTSLLAQVDSSVGGKTAVNSGQIKNLVGTFYQPDLVVVDPQTLTTLSRRDLVAGYGEVVKVAALVGGDFWSLVSQINSPTTILSAAPTLIQKALAFKIQVTSQDEHESGYRQILNFGHTIGHGVEALSGGKLRHGEAVSLGLVAISQIFSAADESGQVLEQIRDRLTAVGLPIFSPLIRSHALMDKIKNDKKNTDGYLRVVFLTALGQGKIQKITLTDLEEKIKQL